MWMHGEPREFSETQIAKYKERFSLHTLEVAGPKEWIEYDEDKKLMALDSDYKPWGVDEHGRPDTTPLGNILSLLRSLGHNPSERELADVLDPEGLDVRVGRFQRPVQEWRFYLDFDNFLKLMGLLKPPWGPEEEKAELRGAFKALDQDGDGFLSASELRNVLTSMGEPLTDKEVDEMFRLVDINNDGKLNFEEFYEMTKQNDLDWD